MSTWSANLWIGLGNLALALIITRPVRSAAPDVVVLWPEGAPGAVGQEDADRPELRIYLPAPERATGTGVVVCPGGAYAVLASDHEGQQVARWLNTQGVAAFVLKYRLGPRYHHPAPLQDAQRALRYARAHASRLRVAESRIGIMGFSAGGHLAATATTHFDAGDSASSDPVERVSSRPDFAILCYPVISLQEPFAHGGSRRNLLGENPDPKLVESLSNETQVTDKTPPVFLFHTAEDAGVPVENSLAFFEACRRAHVPAELHVYQFGPHGVGLSPGDPVTGTWKERLADWLRASGFLSTAARAAVAGTVRIGGEPVRWGMITFVPTGSSAGPVAFAMISRGDFQIPAERGAAVGANRIEVWDLGAVEPRPTIEDARRIDGGTHQCEIKAGANQIVVELEAPKIKS
jgi:acetyl esterase/lipase